MRLHLTNYYNSGQFTLQCDYYAYHRLLFMSKIIIFLETNYTLRMCYN
jgi:hypothetical protein